MTNEEAAQIVTEFEKSGNLPMGYTADVLAPSTTIQGDAYEVVHLIQDNTVRISYTRKNGQPEEITVV
jgi:hypothetical protein